MKQRNLSLLWRNSFLLVFVMSHTLLAEGERKHFLSHGPGAEARGMAEAFTAIADDPTAIYYNPAGLVYQGGSVHAEYTPVFEGGRYNFLGAHYPSNVGSVGFGVIQYAEGDLEGRRTLGDTPKSFGISQTAFLLPFARSFRSLSLGGNLKVLRYELGSGSGTGIGVDGGALYSSDLSDFWFLREPELRSGLTVKNLIEPSLRVVSDRESLPRDFKIGIALRGKAFGRYNRDRDVVVSDRMTLAFDLAKTLKQKTLAAFGAEYSFRDRFPLRMGFDGDFMGGVGYLSRLGTVKADYSFALTGLGVQHRMSLGYQFMPSKVSRVKAIKAEKRVGIIKEVRRFRDRHISRGKELLDRRAYGEALIEFEYARLLDPMNRDARKYSLQAFEGEKREKLRGLLDEAKGSSQQHAYERAAETLIAAARVMPNSEEVKAAIGSLRNEITASAQDLGFPPEGPDSLVAWFDERRDLELKKLETELETAGSLTDIAKAREVALTAKAIYGDHPKLQAFESRLREIEESSYQRAIELSRKARMRGAYSAAYWELSKAMSVHRDADAVRKEFEELDRIDKRLRKEKRLSRVVVEQLYDAAALHYVKGEYSESVKRLNELLAVQPLHKAGNALKGEMIVKNVVIEEVSE